MSSKVGEKKRLYSYPWHPNTLHQWPFQLHWLEYSYISQHHFHVHSKSINRPILIFEYGSIAQRESNLRDINEKKNRKKIALNEELCDEENSISNILNRTYHCQRSMWYLEVERQQHGTQLSHLCHPKR